jgi:hypothetical protein
VGLVYKSQCFRLSSCDTRRLVPELSVCLFYDIISFFLSIPMFLLLCLHYILFSWFVKGICTCLTTLGNSDILITWV